MSNVIDLAAVSDELRRLECIQRHPLFSVKPTMDRKVTLILEKLKYATLPPCDTEA